jgi:HSP20 family molecular chaperone IbpA
MTFTLKGIVMSLASSSSTNNEVVPNVRAASETNKTSAQAETRKLRPAADVFESETAYRIELDLVAVNRDEIAINVERDTLKVSARRTGVPSDPNGNQAVVYERDFTLPGGVDRDGVSATYAAGVLGIVIPKQPSERPRRVPVVTH